MSDFADFFLETARIMSRAQAEEMLTDIALRRAFKELANERDEKLASGAPGELVARIHRVEQGD